MLLEDGDLDEDGDVLGEDEEELAVCCEGEATPQEIDGGERGRQRLEREHGRRDACGGARALDARELRQFVEERAEEDQGGEEGGHAGEECWGGEGRRLEERDDDGRCGGADGDVAGWRAGEEGAPGSIGEVRERVRVDAGRGWSEKGRRHFGKGRKDRPLTAAANVNRNRESEASVTDCCRGDSVYACLLSVLRSSHITTLTLFDDLTIRKFNLLYFLLVCRLIDWSMMNL